MIFDALTIGFVGEFLADLREIVLASGILHVGQKFRPLAYQMTAATEQVSRRPQLRGVTVGLRQHTAPKQNGNLVGSNLLVLGFAPLNGLHREGVS
jgi:hypothetical protein